MKLKTMALLAGLCTAPAFAVTTADYDIPYAGIYYGHEISDSARDSDAGRGLQVNVGLPLDYGRNNALEVSLFDVGRERDVDGRKDYQTALFVDWVHHYASSNAGIAALPAFTPLVLGGIGLVNEDVDGDENLHLGASAGAGLLFPLPWHGLALRTEARAQLQVNDKSVSGEDWLLDYRINVGLQVPLYFLREGGFNTAAPAECPVAVVDPSGQRQDCGADSDGDGIKDGADQCPATPAGVAVKGNGCP
jgi:OOP family OmpA-OmpF porin